MIKTLREKHSNELVLLLIFAVLFVGMTILSPKAFLNPANLINMLAQMPEFGIMAFAMMAAILTGGMNLSIITGSTLAAIIGAMFMRTEWASTKNVLATFIGILIILCVALLTGVFNGFLIGYVGVVAMLVTLGSRMVFEGLGLVITSGKSISIKQPAYLGLSQVRIGPIPVVTIVYILVIILTYFLLERSKWGKQVYMVGDNETATRFSGINTKKTILLVYVFSGLMYGISSIIISSRVCSAKTDYGSAYLMQALTAVVMGGTDITGGRGTVAGTVLAVLILQVLSNGFTVLRMDQNLVNIFNGCILILVLAIRFLTARYQDNKKIKERQKQVMVK